MKRILSLLLIVMLIGLFSVSAYAHDVPDFSRRGDISINMQYDGEAVPGGRLTLYRVADVDTNGADFYFTYTADFADCPVPVELIHSSEIGAALAKIARDKQLAGVTQTIDKNGRTTFSNLELGLYLLVQYTPASGYNVVSPFLVSVPSMVNDRYIYSVDASPKVELEPAPTTVPTETTLPGGKLPQTGQNNWPVPAMAAIGMFLIGIGISLKASAKRKVYEE